MSETTSNNNQTFKLDQLLEDQGLTFSRKDEAGTTYVKTANGEEKKFNVQRLLSDQGVDPSKVNIVYNRPSTAADISSVVSTEDRVRLAGGNARGSIAYLKKKFEDAQYDEDNGFVVKKQGVWHKVDPSLFGSGDPWEIARDIIDVSPELMNAALTTAGAVVGGAAGSVIGGVVGLGLGSLGANPVTAIAGAGLGSRAGGVVGGVAGAGAGGYASAKIRTSFGRIAGTYEATPEEQSQDEALETVLSMGGQTFAVGAKPLLSKLVSAGKNLAPAVARDAIAGVYGKLTGVGSEAMHTLMAAPGQMAGKMKSIAAKAGPRATAEGLQVAAEESADASFKQGMKEYTQAVPRIYGQGLDQLAEMAEGRMGGNRAEIAERALMELEEKGIIKFDADPGKAGVRARMRINEAGMELPPPKVDFKSGKVSFRALTEEEIEQRLAQNLGAETLDAAQMRAIKPLVKTLMAAAKSNQRLDGKAFAKSLTGMQRFLNKHSTKAFESGDSSLQRIVATVTDGFERGVSETFEKAGLGREYAGLAGVYAKHGNLLAGMREAIRNNGGKVTQVAQDLIKGTTKDLTPGTESGKLFVEALGARGQELYRDMVISNAAGKFSRWTPKFNLGSMTSGIGTGALAMKATGTAMGTGVAPIAAGVATQMSPRVVAKEAELAAKYLPYLRQGKDFIQGLPPKQLKQLLSDPRLTDAFLRTVPQSVQREEQDVMNLLQNSGVE